MIELDFSDITGDDEDESSGSQTNAGGQVGQVHIKRTYGTKTYYASDGCEECHRNADVAISATDPEGKRDGMDVKVVLACFEHLGGYTEGFMRGGYEFELHGF